MDLVHATLAAYAQAAHDTFGAIDLDPANCEPAEHVVRAARFYVGCADGLHLPWGGRVFVSLPRDAPSDLIRAFWRRACEHALLGGTDSAVIWVGSSVEQFCFLQRCKSVGASHCPSPMDWPRIIRAIGSGSSIDTQDSYVCFLGGNREQRRRFREHFELFGSYLPGSPHLCRPRDLDDELMAVAREHGPLSKRALIRAVRIRTGTGLAAIDELVASGRLVLRNRKLAFPDAAETLEPHDNRCGNKA